MRPVRISLVIGSFIAAALFAFAARPAVSCPFCSAPSLTFSEQLVQSDAAVLVQWVEAMKGDEEKAGSTAYKVVRIARSPKSAPVEKSELIKLARYRSGKPGDLFFLLGTENKALKKIDWGSPMETTETGYNYIVQAPPPESESLKRLTYFMKFLEFSDDIIASDAYAEFANAPYKAITPLAKIMPREKLREWVQSDDVPATRLGLYGLLLGLCGTKEDAVVMEKKITDDSDEFRLGMDGIMGGYLILTGEKGLEVIERTKLVQGEKNTPFSETYAAMQALRFLWTYGDGRIEKERLRESMRLLLDRPELADLVIADLARWKDWEVREKLLRLYDDKAFDVPSVKRAVVRYLLVCTKDVPSGDDVKLPAHAVAALKDLEMLRKKDPKIVKEAERFFIR